MGDIFGGKPKAPVPQPPPAQIDQREVTGAGDNAKRRRRAAFGRDNTRMGPSLVSPLQNKSLLGG